MNSKYRRLNKIDQIEQGSMLQSTVKDVPLGLMTSSARAQRDLRPSRVKKLLVDFDPDQLGLPVLNERQGHYYIIDGQHRIKALEEWLGPGWEKQKIPCRVYHDLTDQQEANVFDRLNDTLAVSAIDKFKVRVVAGRPDEVIVEKILHSLGLFVGKDRTHHPGTVYCVTTLLSIYRRAGSENLQKSLEIATKAYGDSGLDAATVTGTSLVLDRYAGAIDTDFLTEVLAGIRGGANGLAGRATMIRKQTGNGQNVSTAAAIVDAYNLRATRAKKLPSWWKVEETGDGT